jgi:hypothetical protein
LLPFALNIQAQQGPLPPPDQLAAYEAASPGAAKWILDQAAMNSDHVRTVELQAIASQRRDLFLRRISSRRRRLFIRLSDGRGLTLDIGTTFGKIDVYGLQNDLTARIAAVASRPPYSCPRFSRAPLIRM